MDDITAINPGFWYLPSKYYTLSSPFLQGKIHHLRNYPTFVDLEQN